MHSLLLPCILEPFAHCRRNCPLLCAPCSKECIDVHLGLTLCSTDGYQTGAAAVPTPAQPDGTCKAASECMGAQSCDAFTSCTLLTKVGSASGRSRWGSAVDGTPLRWRGGPSRCDCVQVQQEHAGFRLSHRPARLGGQSTPPLREEACYSTPSPASSPNQAGSACACSATPTQALTQPAA